MFKVLSCITKICSVNEQICDVYGRELITVKQLESEIKYFKYCANVQLHCNNLDFIKLIVSICDGSERHYELCMHMSFSA